jgi:glyoxylase-like metal-dependent hydrolase (beta-lactamase superfamily II)
MKFLDRVDNVYVVDTKMFGFDHFNAAYIVEGEKVALIDCGLANQTEAVFAGIRAHGFSISDLSYLILTHEHGDHTGNTTPILRENPKINVYISPAAEKTLLNPSESRKRETTMPPQMRNRFPDMEPVPASRIRYLNDGDELNLGKGEILKIITTPGHQPGGIVIHSKKSNGLFVNDIVGLNLADTGTTFMFSPPGSDLRLAIESLKKFKDIPVARYYLGHFGIWDDPKEIMRRAMGHIHWLLDMGAQCLAAGKPEEIESRFLEHFLPEAEKLQGIRPQAFYEYISKELLVHLSKNFTKYYMELHPG